MTAAFFSYSFLYLHCSSLGIILLVLNQSLLPGNGTPGEGVNEATAKLLSAALSFQQRRECLLSVVRDFKLSGYFQFQ